MTDADVLRFIREEIRRQLNVILPGSAGGNTSQTEDIDQMLPGMPTITERPVMHPYGFASRAARGVISVVARVGDHLGNRLVLGHRDKDRPASLAEGEACIYSVGKFEIRVAKDRVQIGKDGTYETAVVGEKLTEFLTELMTQLIQHTHPAPGAPPTNVAAFTQAKTQYIDNGKILAKDGGRF